MSVGYKDLSEANMDTEDSNISYKLHMDPRKLRFSVFSVYSLKEYPNRLATVCLGVLCILLLAALIGESVSYCKAQQDNVSKLQSINAENDNIQKNISSIQKDIRNLEGKQRKIKQTLEITTKFTNHYQDSYSSLAVQNGKLRRSETMLKTRNAALTKELQQVNATAVKLQSNTEQLSTAKDLLQVQLEQAVKLKTTLESNSTNLCAEKDILQNSFNNVTRVKDQLQLSYNMLMTDVKDLEKILHVTSTKKDKAEASHMNATTKIKLLQVTYNREVKSTEQLNSSYNRYQIQMQKEEKNCESVRVERNSLQEKNGSLTEERDQLQVEVDKLNATLEAKKCPENGWKPYMQSCYFPSETKKNWQNSRDYCKNKGADLAVITSREEMAFINRLYSSDMEAWIGLSDDGIEERWTWVDGTPLNPKTTFWGNGQPNSRRNQDCVEFWHRGTGHGEWSNENCNTEQFWICALQ